MGRPREFDIDEALERAMQVFWERGYEGVSLADLTKAMGITKPSLYAAFGNKAELFRKALERYNEGPGDYGTRALEEPTGRGVAEAILRGAGRSWPVPRLMPRVVRERGGPCGPWPRRPSRRGMSRRPSLPAVPPRPP